VTNENKKESVMNLICVKIVHSESRQILKTKKTAYVVQENAEAIQLRRSNGNIFIIFIISESFTRKTILCP
jgi:hypothetical protein